MPAVIKFVAMAGQQFGGFPPRPGEYLETYEPNLNDGGSRATWTMDSRWAMKFTDSRAALECWRQVSKKHPVRADGRPNRPLTAYTVEVVEIP